MTAISRKKYINKLDNISNNIYQRKTKMKSADVNSSSYIDKAVETNDKDPKFEVDNHVRIQKYKEILAKGYKRNSCKMLPSKLLRRRFCYQKKAKIV